MRTTIGFVLLLLLALPSVARSHPCEEEIARMKKDLESIRRAVTTIEAVPAGDTRDQMLTGAKARYDFEQRRIKEAQAACDALVAPAGAPPKAAEAPAAAPVPAVVAAPTVPPAPPAVAPAPAATPVPVATPVPAAAPVPAPTPAAAPATVVLVAPAVETVTPVASPPAAPAPQAPAAVVAPAVPPNPCLTGCGKDTDCKGARICVKGECVDPPVKQN